MGRDEGKELLPASLNDKNDSAEALKPPKSATTNMFSAPGAVRGREMH